MAQIAQPVMELPTPYYAAIGEFLFRFAQLEYQLHELVWAGMRLGPKSGRTLTMGTDVNVLHGRIGTITQSTIWIADPALPDELRAIANATKDHADLRNAIARGSWQSLDSSPVNANLHFMRKTPHRILPRIDASLTDTEIARKEQFLHTLNERAKTALAQLAAPRTSP